MTTGAVDQAEVVVRDDRVLPLTRVVSAAVIPVLGAAFVILFVFPSRTHQLWGWTIHSHMSAMFMGGGYLAGAVFFARAALARQWHQVGAGIVATTGFATLLGVATFVHWPLFNHWHVSFWAWVALYVSTPLLLPLLWVRNQRFDPRSPEPGDAIVPTGLRVAMAVLGAAQLVFALTLFARPSLFQARWPWPLETLSARSLAGFSTFPAISYLAFAFERRWSALRVPFETAMLGLVFVGIAGVRAAGEFRSGWQVWGWRVGLLATLAFLAAVWVAMWRANRQQVSGPARGPGPT